MTALQFLGATGSVTGSRFLLESENHRLLVDCGMFQGLKTLRLRNWEAFPTAPAKIDCVVLTHAHIDHSGYLPRLVKEGFKGRIYATSATADLCAIMLPDSAHIQEEDAAYANKKRFTKHSPARPLYTVKDALKALGQFEPQQYGDEIVVSDTIRLTFRDAGHILGSSFVDLQIHHDGEARRILFTGDLGRPGQPILRDPATVYGTDYLVVESTYGNRLHGDHHPGEHLASVINQTHQEGGILLIPSFAVGRSQQLLYTIRELEESGSIPVLPIYLDSPMAAEATAVFEQHSRDHDLEAKSLALGGTEILRPRKLQIVKSAQESKALNKISGRAIIISASGMATGGRILHHLANRLPVARNTVLFIGHQAAGTRGRTILDGSPNVKIHGRYFPVNARIETISGFSAHADYNEILAWLANFNQPPRKVFVVHGEEESSQAMAEKIRTSFSWEVVVPEYLEKIPLE